MMKTSHKHCFLPPLPALRHPMISTSRDTDSPGRSVPPRAPRLAPSLGRAAESCCPARRRPPGVSALYRSVTDSYMSRSRLGFVHQLGMAGGAEGEGMRQWRRDGDREIRARRQKDESEKRETQRAENNCLFSSARFGSGYIWITVQVQI
eukprot:750541-Hanusia_phi.AAC.5